MWTDFFVILDTFNFQEYIIMYYIIKNFTINVKKKIKIEILKIQVHDW